MNPILESENSLPEVEIRFFRACRGRLQPQFAPFLKLVVFFEAERKHRLGELILAQRISQFHVNNTSIDRAHLAR